MRKILIINQSTVVKDADAHATVAALQVQVDKHFFPVWDLDASLSHITVASTASVNPAQECIFILDNSDQAGALGYHQLQPDDYPRGFVFAKTCEENNTTWSSCLSHELLEQLVDPLANAAVTVTLPSNFGADANKAAAVAYEVCDPVENDGYNIQGVQVSNFVLPSWFVDTYDKTAVTKFDYLGKLKASLALDSGGYVSYTTDLQNWSQVTAKLAKTPASRAHGVHKATTYHRHGGHKVV